MRRLVSGLALLFLAVVAAWAGDTQSSLRCTLTGEKIVTCCCEQKDGKLYCPLAKQAIDNCCCESADR